MKSTPVSQAPLPNPIGTAYNRSQGSQSNTYESMLVDPDPPNNYQTSGSYRSQASSLRAPIPAASVYSSSNSSAASFGSDSSLHRREKRNNSFQIREAILIRKMKSIPIDHRASTTPPSHRKARRRLTPPGRFLALRRAERSIHSPKQHPSPLIPTGRSEQAKTCTTELLVSRIF